MEDTGNLVTVVRDILKRSRSATRKSVTGDTMVFVKVRETYDLHTTKNKMTVIGIHTPKPDIIKKNFPGLLMQCKSYRPYSCDVRVACASVLPLDPLGVGTGSGDVAPEDVFNPILYKAMSNKGMSQLEARINAMRQPAFGVDVAGYSADIDVDSVTPNADEFPIYYGLLSNAHGWKHANPQAGLEMNGLKPLVFEMVYNIGDMPGPFTESMDASVPVPGPTGAGIGLPLERIIGKPKEFPFLNTTAWALTNAKDLAGAIPSGFPNPDESHGDYNPYNAETTVPWLNVFVGAIIVPPSKLHELFYRMVVEWTIEFSAIRPIGEITDWSGLATIGGFTHYQNYSYSSAKKAITGSEESIMDSEAAMVSANVEVDKVM